MAGIRSRRKASVTFDTVRQLALELPEAQEGTSYGTSAYFVRRKLFARHHQDGESLVIRIDFSDRDLRMQADPQAFYITDHYLKYPFMLVRVAYIYQDDLRELLAESWRRSAPQRLVAAYDACH
jgi:hypothetical protein